MENRIPSYPSVFQIGHKAISDLLSGPVTIEEKIDGSQFSFSKRDGKLFCRSKNQQIDVDAPDNMFAAAVETAKSIAATAIDGWTYRCEYLQKPKHNVLAYARVPVGNLIIFDIDRAVEDYLSYEEKIKETNRIGLECVPLLFDGTISSKDDLVKLLELESCLGGQKIEGVVVKNYSLFGQDKKILTGKFVREDFKEQHRIEWQALNPSASFVIDRIGNSLCTTARWQKAVQHLRDRGVLEDSPRDIGLLFKEVSSDVLSECEEEIKDALLKWAWKDISRLVTRGLPEWYKQQLADSQFAFVQERTVEYNQPVKGVNDGGTIV